MNYAKKLVSLVSLSTLALTVSCGKSGDPSSEFETVNSSIIVGSLDWVSVTTLPEEGAERGNSRGVVHVDLPMMGSRCTGFLIADDVVMTNQHCVPSEFYARDITVSFEVEDGVAEGQEQRYDCSTFIGNNQELDFALLKCETSLGGSHRVVELSEESFSSGDVYIVQQNCDYYTDRSCYHTKKISYGSSNLQGDSLVHDADTLGGSSGSPVFSKGSHKVVAIHHAGLGNNGQGRGIENYGVPMAKIVPFIKANFPEVALGSSSTQPDPDPAPQPSNDTFEGATSLALNKVMNGEVSDASDVDYYKFTLEDRGRISIELNIDGPQDLDLYVYDANQNLLARSESLKALEVISGTAPAGDYYALVKGYKGATGAYKLSVKK